MLKTHKIKTYEITPSKSGQIVGHPLVKK